VNDALDLETEKFIVLKIFLDVNVVQFGLKFEGVCLSSLWESGCNGDKGE
jgi:hypothetical protein